MGSVSELVRRALSPRAPAPSDEEICRRVVAGETALYELLVRRNNLKLYRAIRSVLRDEDEVEDAMQQTYVQAYAHLADFAHAAPFSSWLLRIGMREALARARRRGRLVAWDAERQEAEDALPDARRPDPEAVAMSNEFASALEEAIDGLPRIYRTVFMLRELTGASTAEAAAILEISEDAVKQRLKRGRALIRRTLQARFGRSLRDTFGFPVPRCDRVVAAVLHKLASD